MAKGTITGSPLSLGKTFPVTSASPTGAGSEVVEFGLDTDGILVSLAVPSITGSLQLVVETLGDKDEVKEAITFPLVTSFTAEPIYRTAVNVLSRIRVTVTFTGACSYQVRAKGISRGGVLSDDSPGMTLDLSELTVTNPTITNTVLTTANTEQAVVLPAGTKRFSLKARNDARLQYSYSSGQSGVAYYTIWPGTSEDEDRIDEPGSLTIFVQASKSSTVLEIKSWT